MATMDATTAGIMAATTAASRKSMSSILSATRLAVTAHRR